VFAGRCVDARYLAVGKAHPFARTAVAATIAAAPTSTVAALLARLAGLAFAFARCPRRARVVVGGTHPIVVGRSDRVRCRTGVARLAVRSNAVALIAGDVVAVAIAATAAAAPPPAALTLARGRRLVALRQGVGERRLHRLLCFGGSLGDRRIVALRTGARIAARFATGLASRLATRLGTIAIATVAAIVAFAALTALPALTAFASTTAALARFAAGARFGTAALARCVATVAPCTPFAVRLRAFA